MIFASQVLKVAIFALSMMESANADGTSPLPDHGIGGNTPGPFNLSKDLIRENPRRKRAKDRRKLQAEKAPTPEKNERLSWPWQWFGNKPSRETCSWAINRLKYD